MRRLKRGILLPVHLFCYLFIALHRGYWALRGVKYIEDDTLNGMPEDYIKEIRGYVTEEDIKDLFRDFYHPVFWGGFKKTSDYDKKWGIANNKKGRLTIARRSKRYEIYRRSPSLQRYYGVTKIFMEKDHLPIDKEYSYNYEFFRMVRESTEEFLNPLKDKIKEVEDHWNKLNKERDRINFFTTVIRSSEVPGTGDLAELHYEDQKAFVTEHLKGLYKRVYKAPFGFCNKIMKYLPAFISIHYFDKIEEYESAYDDIDPKGYFDRKMDHLEQLARDVFGENIEYYMGVYKRAVKNSNRPTMNVFERRCRRSEFFKDVVDKRTLEERYRELVKRVHPDNGGDTAQFIKLRSEYVSIKEAY